MPVESAKKSPWMVRVSDELKERLGELGRPLGMTGNQFAAEALERYADVLAEVMIKERGAHQQVSEEHRRMLIEALQSASSRQ